MDSIGLDGWRIDVGYSEDRDEAERRLTGEGETETESTADSVVESGD